jgi:hypothetical protein
MDEECLMSIAGSVGIVSSILGWVQPTDPKALLAGGLRLAPTTRLVHQRNGMRVKAQDRRSWL